MNATVLPLMVSPQPPTAVRCHILGGYKEKRIGNCQTMNAAVLSRMISPRTPTAISRRIAISTAPLYDSSKSSRHFHFSTKILACGGDDAGGMDDEAARKLELIKMLARFRDAVLGGQTAEDPKTFWKESFPEFAEDLENAWNSAEEYFEAVGYEGMMEMEAGKMTGEDEKKDGNNGAELEEGKMKDGEEDVGGMNDEPARKLEHITMLARFRDAVLGGRTAEDPKTFWKGSFPEFAEDVENAWNCAEEYFEAVGYEGKMEMEAGKMTGEDGKKGVDDGDGNNEVELEEGKMKDGNDEDEEVGSMNEEELIKFLVRLRDAMLGNETAEDPRTFWKESFPEYAEYLEHEFKLAEEFYEAVGYEGMMDMEAVGYEGMMDMEAGKMTGEDEKKGVDDGDGNNEVELEEGKMKDGNDEVHDADGGMKDPDCDGSVEDDG